MVMMLALSSAPPRAQAANASNTLPMDGWRARAPNEWSPPNPLSVTLGIFPTADEAFLALDRWATSHGPLNDPEQRKFSSGLTEAPPGSTVDFTPDPDHDGEVDVHLYTEPLSEFGAFPHNCAYGDQGLRFPVGGAIGPLSALVYEPVVDPGRRDGPLTVALCARAWCQSVSGCTGQGNVSHFHRRAVATFAAKYEASNMVCDNDRKLVFEDLLGRAGGTQTCKADGGLNDGANLGGDCPSLANGSNPVNTVTGNKYQREQDYAGTVHGELRFVRYYNSLLSEHRDIGLGWRHSFSASLTVISARNGDESARLTRADGRVLVFNRVARTTQFNADPLTVGSLRVVDGTRYEYSDGDDVRERYGLAVADTVSRGTVKHLLLESRDDPRSARHETLRYDERRLLAQVTGRFGRSLSFMHDAQGRLREMTDAAGRRYVYDYDRRGYLLGVTYPDLDDRSDDETTRANNPRRAYRYEDPDWPKGLTDIIDEGGASYAHWDYDARGRAVLSEHAGGSQRVVFDYQPAYTAITDALGQTRTYNTHVEYGVGLITAVSGGNCNFCGAGPLAATTYDANGHRNLVSDHLGNVTDFDYDQRGLELRRSEGSGDEQRITATSWRADLRLPATQTVSDGNGHEIRRLNYEYWGGLIKQRREQDLLTGGATRVVTYHYFGEEDASDPRYGMLQSEDGPREDVSDLTRYDYDPVTGNMLSMTDAAGQVTRYTAHDAEGRVLTAVDANGVETHFEYDARGRLIMQSVAGAATRMHYDLRGLLSDVIFPDQSAQHYRYDAAQRLVRVEDAVGVAIEYTLDALGNRVAERHLGSDGQAVSELRRIFNRHNQVEQLIAGAGQTSGYLYDANGRLQTMLDPRGNGLASSREYDSLGRPRAMTDNLGGQTRVSYDSNDLPISITDPRGLATRYQRDGFGQLLVTASPDAGNSRDEYDAAGNRVRHVYQQKPGVDIAIGYRYDALNRLIKIDYPTDPDVIYGYDEGEAERHGRGRLTSMQDALGLTTFSYDTQGNLSHRITVNSQGSFMTGYGYDANGRVTLMRYPSGLEVRFERDAAGHVAKVDATLGAVAIPIASAIAYHPLGGVARLTLANGVTESRRYDEAGRLLAIESSEARLPSYRYPAYDAADNLLQSEESVAEQGPAKILQRNFRYDALSRLSFEDSAELGLARRYGYDANGNRILYQQTDLAGRALSTDNYTVEPNSNRIHASAVYGGDYDEAGNMSRYVVSPSANVQVNGVRRFDMNFTYNEAGRLTTVTNPLSATLVMSSYNGQGERALRLAEMTQRLPEVLTYGLNGEVLSAAGKAGKGYVYREYLWLDERPLAEIQVTRGNTTPRVNFIHNNQINQPQYMSGPSGRLTWKWQVGDAFGLGSKALTDPDGDGVTEAPVIGGAFPGQVRDGVLFSNGFRDYDPRTGRYVESDPIGLAGGINTYAYVTNNPLLHIDPFGLDRTRLTNTDGDRPFRDGPTNGNWGGKCWSGGAYSCGGQPSGDAPPTDSADRCYKHHDKCYEECGDSPDEKCIAACNARLVEELEELPNDPRWWATPPRPGTMVDSRRFRDAAIKYFRR